MNAQPGIFALGTPEHGYLEFDLAHDAEPSDLVTAAAGLVEPLSTTGGVNLVVGFRPELWAEAADPADVPTSARGFEQPLVGTGGWTMPATQHDAWMWVAGGDRTAVFDNGRAIVTGLAPVARLRRETTGWAYRHDRDLTGFIDGTENPSLLEAPAAALVPAGEPGAGSSVVLVQMWEHDGDGWESLPTQAQENVMGRAALTRPAGSAGFLPPGPTASNWTTRPSRPTATSRAPSWRSTARSCRSSGATWPSAASRGTAPRSSASAATSGAWRRCCGGWPVSATACATR